MKWLLDTNVVSESVRRRPSKTVLEWVAQRSASDSAISIITLAELRVGTELTASPQRRAELTRWVSNEIERSFAERTLPLTIAILVEWLQLGRRNAVAGKTRSPVDLLIAATARVHDLIVVTRNARDFAGTGVVVYDPWNDRTHQMELA